MDTDLRVLQSHIHITWWLLNMLWHYHKHLLSHAVIHMGVTESIALHTVLVQKLDHTFEAHVYMMTVYCTHAYIMLHPIPILSCTLVHAHKQGWVTPVYNHILNSMWMYAQHCKFIICNLQWQENTMIHIMCWHGVYRCCCWWVLLPTWHMRKLSKEM